MLSPLYAHWFPPNNGVSGPVYFLWWKQLLVTVISQSAGYVRDSQPLILLSILRAEVWFLFHPWQPWHHLHGILKLYPMVLFFSSQTLLKKSVISFRVDGTECVLHVFCDLFSMRAFFLSTFAITLSISQYKGLPLSCSGSEVRFDLLRTSFEMLVQTVFYLKSTAVIY